MWADRVINGEIPVNQRFEMKPVTDLIPVEMLILDLSEEPLGSHRCSAGVWGQYVRVLTLPFQQ